MKIGIMGGTFDPIHIGHLLLGEFAYEDFGLDEIWFLPNGNPPHKETADTGTSLEHRIEMIRKAIEGVPHFRLNLHEANTEEHCTIWSLSRKKRKWFGGSTKTSCRDRASGKSRAGWTRRESSPERERSGPSPPLRIS